ncbi:PEP-CTERM sorting domain-containing protein [Verrucomicrobium sp. BvORR034]|uniref:PEP-CTERM sorting domain-containing protein n=1 Tax=Verrucomicrobium sp. BvORR034 TaxID=1396418 RepID=UPI000678EF38|nr:PEP-CTERM sorting domain-containing protein [Verrucomicrobium sp. BvORR034]
MISAFKSFKLPLVLCGLLAISLGEAEAAVTFDIQADALKTNGGALAPTSTLVLLVADTGNNGFGQIAAGQSLSVNSVLGGSDDRIVGIYDLSLNNVAGYFQVLASNLELTSVTGWSVGDGLALVWFPTLTLGDINGTVSASTSYGSFSGPPVVGNAWTTPENTTASLYFFNESGTLSPGTIPAAAGNASNTVSAVPEPSVSLLAMAGAMFAVFGRRRRQNRHP